jgi:ABC-type phosphate transport system substrate-binding protein
MKYSRILISAAGLLLFSMNVLAAGLKIIANPSVGPSAISPGDLKNIFLEEKSSLSDGSRVSPVLAKGGPTHEVFVRQYIGKTEDALQTYYRSLVFTGKGIMPKTFGSETEVLEYVAKTKGAIGYVSAAAATEGVKVLEVK